MYLQWEPPNNTDRFILANYTVQIGNKTIKIERSKTEDFFFIPNEFVTTGTFVLVSRCGIFHKYQCNIKFYIIRFTFCHYHIKSWCSSPNSKLSYTVYHSTSISGNNNIICFDSGINLSIKKDKNH